MKTKSLRWIILLMSLSLIGLVSFQLFWIWRLSEEKTKEFNKDINEALTSVSKGIENRETFLFINQFKTNTSFGADEDQKIIISYNTTESTDSGNSKSTIRKVSSITKKVHAKGGKIQVWTDTSLNTDKFKIVSQFLKTKENLSESIDEMAMEFAFNSKSLKERLEGIDIDSLISSAISNQGIDSLAYSFSIYSNDSIPTTNPKNKLQSYKVPLFKGGDKLSEGILEITLKGKTHYIFKSILPSVLISLLLIFILISTFAYTLKSIYRQKRISRIKSDFINNMTHEFKTPVATISLAIDTMLHDKVKRNPEELDRFGNIIKKENNRMNSQIERLLEMALFDREEVKLNPEILNINEIVEEIQSDFLLKSNTEKGKTELVLCSDHPKIFADKMHFYNVLRNLIDNGIKYSLPPFDILIKTFSKNESTFVEVSDKGIGMSSDTQKKIFRRFYRKQSGDIHETKGFGLGLAYSKEIIEKMGGKIAVSSQLKKGSIFIIQFDRKVNG